MRILPSAKGFTLIELLVAIAILALVAILSWRGLDSILRSREALSQAMQQSRSLQAAFQQLEADLRSVARDVGAQTTLPGVQLAAGQLQLLRYQFGTDRAGRWQLVRYSLDEGQLQRRAVSVNSRVELVRWQSQPEAWSSLEPQTLVSNVRSLSWQVSGQAGFATAEPGAVQRISQAQAMGMHSERVGIQLRLELNTDERFVRQWAVRE
jgi:general secretion pathway protein J